MSTLSKPLIKFIVLDATEVDIEQESLAGIAQVSCLSAKQRDGSDISAEQLKGADVIGVWHTVQLSRQFIEDKFPASVRLVCRYGVGYCNIDLEACSARKIHVCNVPSYGTEEVADSTLSLILALYRQTVTLSAAIQIHGRCVQGPDHIAAAASEFGGRPDASGRKAVTACRRIRGEVLGIVGLGRIGAAVAIRAKVFGFKIIAFDPHCAMGWEKAIGVDERVATLEELLQKSDCVTLHANSTKENRRMINAAAFKTMNKWAFLVNTARGELVDEDALRDALETGEICAAALDVHEEEPFTSSHKLGRCPNLICVPHSAWYSRESRIEMRSIAAGYVKSLAEQLASGVSQNKLKFLARVNSIE